MCLDGRVTRDEFEQYFKQRDDEHHRQRIQTDQFFKARTFFVPLKSIVKFA